MSEVRHVFLQSRYRADWVIRVSRYKAVEVLENSLGIVILLTVLERSGFYRYYSPVMRAGAKAKTVTSLLIIPSVLYVVFYFFLLGRDPGNRSRYHNKTKLSPEFNASGLNRGITI